MSAPKPSLAKAIKTHFAPTLRRDGFSGTGQRYRRMIGGQCQVVAIQGSRYGGKFAVNMGIQPMSSPLLRSGETPDPRRIHEGDCMFRKRLAIQRSDQWWDYGPNQLSMDAAAHSACAVYERVGRDQLDLMAQSNSLLNTLTPKAFAEGGFDLKGFANTRVLMAWTLAHMRKAEGRTAEARGFAELALKIIGDGRTGSALKASLRELLMCAPDEQAK